MCILGQLISLGASVFPRANAARDCRAGMAADPGGVTAD